MEKTKNWRVVTRTDLMLFFYLVMINLACLAVIKLVNSGTLADKSVPQQEYYLPAD